MEKIITIKYAPNTTLIVGSIHNPEIKILNSKNSGKNKYDDYNKSILDHC